MTYSFWKGLTTQQIICNNTSLLRLMVLNNWSESLFLNFITSVLFNVFCVYFFNFLYLSKLKSTCKHKIHCSHHPLSDVVWSLFISWARILWHWKITRNSYQRTIDLDFLVFQKHLFCFCNSYIYASWMSNTLVTKSIKILFNFLQRQVLETHYAYFVC